MDAALIASAALLGLAGTPHCAAMCGAPCAAATGGGAPASAAAFHAARIAGYAVGGAVVASSIGALAALSQTAPALRPLWTALHVAALSLGLWLLVVGRQPAWLGRVGRVPVPAEARGWQRVRGPAAASAAGAVWIGWPCGLLQSALVVAGLTGGAAAGAAAMAAFAVASSAGLVAAPWLWRRWLQGPRAADRERWIVRTAGAMLVGTSAWVLGHGLWHRVVAFCATL